MKNEASTRARGALAFWTDQLRKLNLSEEMELLRGASLLDEPDLEKGGDLATPDTGAAVAEELMQVMNAEITEELMAEAIAGGDSEADDSDEDSSEDSEDSEDSKADDSDEDSEDSEEEDSEDSEADEDFGDEDDEDDADEIDESNVPMQDEDEFFGHIDDPVNDFPPTDEKD